MTLRLEWLRTLKRQKDRITRLSTVKDAMNQKYDAKAVRPCVGGGLVVEAHFDKGFSMKALCRLLQGIAQCSEKLGVARLFHEGRSLTLYRSGRVDVHRAESENEAIRLIDDIKPMIEEAFVD